MKQTFRILIILLQKEIKQMKATPLIPRVIVMMPLMVMLVMPLVADLDVKHVNISVIDNDHSQLSTKIIASLNAPHDMSVVALCSTPQEAYDLLTAGKTDVIVNIPPRFHQSPSPIDIQANGVNSFRGVLGAQYVSENIAMTLMPHHDNQISVVNMFNPTMSFRNFMIPAFVAMLLIIMCGFLPAINLVQETESGTVEAINVSPVGKFTFILSKLIPFWVVGMVVLTVGIIVGYYVYNLAPTGSIAAIYLAAFIFSLAMSALGVIVANYSSTMLQSIFTMFAIILVFQLMSGLFTPVSAMPQWGQAISYLIPPRYFNEIMRGLYLKGATIPDLWPQYTALAGFALVLSVIAALTYRKVR